MDDLDLLWEYAARRSEDAFSRLMARHASMVYCAALRQVRDPDLAEEVTQAVFLVLARKAGAFRAGTVLSGWLLRATRFTAANALRRERRRQHLKQTLMANTLPPTERDSDWKRIAPLLDEAMIRLNEKDRAALALRFFENKGLREVGLALGTTEDSAQKRVARALDKLRTFFARRGHTVPTAALGAALSSHSVHAAPAGLESALSAAVFGPHGSTMASLSGLCRETLWSLGRARLREWTLRSAAALVLATGLIMGLQSRLGRDIPAKDQALVGVEEPTIIPGSTAEATLPASPPTRIEDRFVFSVLDSQSGAPVPGAGLTLVETAAFPERTTNVFETDGSGLAALPPPRAAGTNWNYHIEVYRDGYIPKYVSWGAYLGDEPEGFPTAYTTRLDPGTRIGGTVVNENQAPIHGVRVVFSVNGSLPDMRARERLTWMGDYHSESTDSLGRWSCDHVPARFGAISWRLVHPEHQQATYYCNASETADVMGVARLPMEEIRAGRAVMVMKRGLVVAGLVQDEAGRPIAGARATLERYFWRPEASLITGVDGRFRFANARERDMALTVQAEGYAPENRMIRASTGLEEQRFTLTRGSALFGRVLDESGLPIARASARVTADARGREVFDWVARTDEEGRFAWTNAPHVPQLYSIQAEGYESQHRLSLAADGQEHVIHLNRRAGQRLRVTARARDADTGLPLESFQMFKSEIRMENGGMSISSLESAGSGRSGKASFTISSYASRFAAEARADGYIPIRSTNDNSGQGELTLEFALHKGQPVRGVVHSPQGQPVAGATVLLCAGQNMAYLNSPGEFQLNRSPDTARTETDGSGRFSFSPRIEMRAVAVAHPLGFAEVPLESLAEPGIVPLRPWGRVQGVLRLGAVQGPGEEIWLQSVYSHPAAGPAVQVSLITQADASGRFAFEGVPPGEWRVSHRPSSLNGKTRVIPLSHGLPVNVPPGETARIVLGGGGRTLLGRVEVDRASTPIHWQRDVHTLKLRLPPAIESMKPQRQNFDSDLEFARAWREFTAQSLAFWTSEQGREFQRAQREYVLLFEPDGAFRVDDVPPGEYKLSVIPTESEAASPGDVIGAFPGGRSIGSLEIEVVVPKGGGAENDPPIDLGVLKLAPR